MSNRHVETERTYELADDTTVLPDLAAAGVVAAVHDGGVHELDATYLDTSDLQLIRRGVTVRRRTGGTDAGWHLKLPVRADIRQEVHWPLGDGDDVPGDLRESLTALTGGRDLAPIVRLSTTRRRSLLCNDSGDVLAELCDDRVRASMLQPAGDEDGGQAVVVWRECEVELVDGDTDDLEAIGAGLERAGAVRAAVQSKLARALGDVRVDPGPVSSLPAEPSAGDVLTDYIAAELERLRWADVSLRVDPDGPGVHDVRVQARRLRTALAVNRPLVDEPVAHRLEQELKLLGQLLSGVRDQQVAAQLLASRLSAMADGASTSALVERMHEGSDAQAGAVAEMRAGLGSDRYLRLLDDLDAVVGGEHLSELADEAAGEALRRHVGRALRRVQKNAKRARRSSGEERTEALHDVRKSAKRLRYACELAEPVMGEPARRLGQRAKQVQQVFGDHLDRVALVARVEELARTDGVAASDAFVLGRLYAELQADIHDSTTNQQRALRRLTRGKATHWLD